jgi:transposase
MPHQKGGIIMQANTLYVGIDVSKHRHDVVMVDARKQLCGAPFFIEENADGYRQLWQRLQKQRQKHGCQQLYIGMEATGEYWKNLYYFLCRQNSSGNQIRICVINPIRTKAFSQSELRRARTDVTSARDIALFMAEKSPQPSRYPDPDLLIIKDLYSRIVQLKKQMAALKNRLRLELIKTAPELEQAMASPASEQMMALLLHFPTARAIQGASIEQLRHIRYGKRQWPLPLTFLQRVKTLTAHSVAYQQQPEAGWVIQSLIRHLKYLKSEVHSLQEQMKQGYHFLPKQHHLHHDIQLLTTIPGIGEVSAMVLCAHIGDIQRFSNARRLVAYFGMNPTVHKSGKSVNRTSHLQKKGSHIVRRILFMATLVNIQRKKQPFYDYYQRLRNNGKHKMVAIAATMRKLLITVYAVLKHQKPFKYNGSSYT